MLVSPVRQASLYSYGLADPLGDNYKSLADAKTKTKTKNLYA